MNVAVINKRRNPEVSSPAIYIGRSSPLNNPFKMSKTVDREEMLARYAAWLDAQITEPASAAACEMARLHAILEERGELTLVCWCAPLPCHGDVIRERLLSRCATGGVVVRH